MKYIVKKISLLITIIVFTNLSAQISVPILAYKEALSIVNPAQVGANKHFEAMALIKTQTMEAVNSAQTQFFSLTAPLGRNMSGGLSIVNDKYHITKETQVYLDAAYTLKIDETKNILFGLKTGWTSLSVDLPSLGKDNDNSLNQPVKRPFNVNFGTGLYLQADEYYVGLSIPRILKVKRYAPLDTNSKATDKAQFYFNSGYTFDFSKENMQMSLKPSFMLRHDTSASTVAELGVLLEMMNKFEFGVSNRFKESFMVLGMLKFMDKYKVGYGFESLTSDLKGSSHQFALRATF